MALLKEPPHRSSIALPAAALLVLLTGCVTHSSAARDQQLQQQAAADASRARRDLNQAGSEARQALGQARRETKDALAGAREGWDQSSGKGTGAIDINHAGQLTLLMLPGIGPASARAIVDGRPWSSIRQLETRHVLTRAEYQRLAGLITVRPGP